MASVSTPETEKKKNSCLLKQGLVYYTCKCLGIFSKWITKVGDWSKLLAIIISLHKTYLESGPGLQLEIMGPHTVLDCKL